MSVALLLLLPILLSGYIFATKCQLTNYKIMRLEGYHLYFRAARYGSIFVVVSAIIYLSVYALVPDSVILFVSKLKSSFDGVFKSNNSSIFDLVIVAINSVVLAHFSAWITNSVIPGEYSFFKAIENDDFELLLYKASVNEEPVVVSMENKKEYVGYVIRGYEPTEERKFLRILPVMSGHRKKENGKVEFTTPYEVVIHELQNNGSNLDFSASDFEIVLPVVDVKSAHLFDFDTYKAFQKKKHTS